MINCMWIDVVCYDDECTKKFWETMYYGASGQKKRELRFKETNRVVLYRSVILSCPLCPTDQRVVDSGCLSKVGTRIDLETRNMADFV